jgi:hypothetical protein
MIIEYNLTKEDLFKFNFYVGWTSPEKKNHRIKYYLKSILWPVLVVLLVLTTANKKLSVDIILSCIAFGLFVGLISTYVSIHSLYRRRIEKFIDDPNNSNLFGRNWLVLDDSGITSKDEHSETHYRWNAITKKSETKDYFYLFLNSANAIVIPKTILDEKEKIELTDLLNRNLSLTAEFTTVFSA